MYDYHNELIKLGYKKIGSGFMHNAYEKENMVFKLTHFQKHMLNNKSHFEKEKENIQILKALGLPLVNVYEIYNENDIIPGYYVMREERLFGFNFTWNTIPFEYKDVLLQYVLNCSIRYKGERFGRIISSVEHYSIWKSYIFHKLRNYNSLKQKYNFKLSYKELIEMGEKVIDDEVTPQLLLMDFSPTNFFFDKSKKIIGIIDMDHSLYGDSEYQIADLLVNTNENDCYFFKKHNFDITSPKMLYYRLISCIHHIHFREYVNENTSYHVNYYKKIEQNLCK